MTGKDAEVQILIDSYSGEAETLVAAANPVEWSEDEDSDLTNAVRVKTGYIRVVEERKNDDLRPLLDNTHKVNIYVGGTVVFRGFIQAQAFANDFAPYPHTYEVPITSPLGLLEGFKFSERAPGYVSIGKLLQEVASTLNITQIVFPATPFDGSNAGLGDLIDSQLVCPYGNADVADPTKPLYEPENYSVFIEALCHAYGVVLHEHGEQWVFVRPNYTGSYLVIPRGYLDDLSYTYDPGNSGGDTVDIESQFSFASADNTEETIFPLRELEFDYGDAIKSGSVNYRRTQRRGNQINNSTEVVQILTPLTDEISSSNFVPSATMDSDGQMSASGLYLCAYGSHDTVSPGLLKFGTGRPHVLLRFYTRPFDTGFNLKFSSLIGERISELEKGAVSPILNIKCGNYYYTGGYVVNAGWRENNAESDSYNGRTVGDYQIYIPNPPQKGHPLEIDLSFGSDKAFAVIGSISLSVGESAVGEWVGSNPDTKRSIEGAPGAKEKKTLSLLFSYDRGDHRPVYKDNSYSYAIGLAPDYNFLFQSQNRLILHLRGDMPLNAYVLQYTIQGMTYRLIAHSYNLSDDIHTLTLQTVNS